MQQTIETQFTDEIYEHASLLLAEPSQMRPILGNIYLRGERAYYACGYTLYDFPANMIDVGDWLAEHCYRWEDSEEAQKCYTKWDDKLDDIIPNLASVTDLLPCARAIVEGNERLSYPNPDTVYQSIKWDEVKPISALELWAICYRQKQRWIGKGGAIMNVPQTPINVLVENMERALNFPLILLSDNLSITVGDVAIKLSNGDAHVLIMGNLGEENPA